MNTNKWTPKLFSMLREGISRKQLKTEISSGIMVGIIALPLAIAFAIASGVSPEKGIITAIIAGFIISFLGGSRVQIGGPTGAFIIVVYSIIQQYGYSGLVISTVMAGVMLILMGLFRMGSLLKYIPQTLITGFTAAIAFLIFTTQVKDFLGFSEGKIPEEFLAKWLYYFQNLHNLNPWSVLIGMITILLIIIIPKLTKKIPPAIVALIITTLIVRFAHLPVDTIYSRFGDLAFSMPSLSIPMVDFKTIGHLLIPAATIAILGSLESLLSAVVADGMIGSNHRSNTELIAQGIANIVAPLFGGIPATGAIARTAANINNGGRTPISGIVHSLTLLLIYLVAMPIVKYIPMSTLAGILILIAWNMCERKEFINTLKINVYEALVLLTTFLLTLLTDLTIAIPIGFVLSTILFMKRMSDSVEFIPLMTTKENEDSMFSQEIGAYSSEIMIYEINGPMFFGSVHHLLTINKGIRSKHQVLVLRFRYVPIVDASGLIKLQSIVKDFEKKNVKVVFSGVNDKIRKKIVNNGILTKKEIFTDIKDAVAYGESLLSKRVKS